MWYAALGAGGGDRADGFSGSSTRAHFHVLRMPGAGCCPSALDEGGLQPWRSFAHAGGPPLSSAFVVSGAESSPGDQAGARLLYLPPCSPDLNLIEKAWAKLKALLRAQGARSPEALHTAVAKLLQHIRPQDADAWFRLRLVRCTYR